MLLQASLCGMADSVSFFLLMTLLGYRFIDGRNLTKYNEGFLDIYKIPRNEYPNNSIIFALNLPFELCDYKHGSSTISCFDRHAGSLFNTAKYYASAAAVAVEDVNNSDMLKGKKLYYVWNYNETDTHCFEHDAIKIQHKQINMGIDGFIGYTCKCTTVAKNAAAYNLPIFSPVSTAISRVFLFILQCYIYFTVFELSALGIVIVIMKLIAFLRKYLL